jgi:hypothetical protein
MTGWNRIDRIRTGISYHNLLNPVDPANPVILSGFP